MRVFVCAMLAAGALTAPPGWALMPDGLMCELLAKPGLVAVTDAAEEFSWGFKDAQPGDVQSAYQVQAASSTSFVKTGAPDLWDSGRVASAQSLHVPYAGRPLPAAAYANTCYSLLAPGYGISVAGVYRAEQGRLVEVAGAGGVSPLDASPDFRAAEAAYGDAWYAAISADTWGAGA